jgi:hypothetical protein
MISTLRGVHRLVVASAAVVQLLHPARAAAADACREAIARAGRQEQRGHLLEARRLLGQCLHASCSSGVQRVCRDERDDLDRLIPSIVVAVTDDVGAPQIDVMLEVDGAPSRDALDGRAIPLDPGPHQLRFRGPRGSFATEKVVLGHGERNRKVEVELQFPPSLPPVAVVVPPTVAAPPPVLVATPIRRHIAAAAALPSPPLSPPLPTPSPPLPTPAPPLATPAPPLATLSAAPLAPAAIADSASPPRAPRPSVGPYALGTVGLVGLGGYGLLTYWGRKDNDQLARCTPSCRPEDLDHIRALYRAANISAAVGVAALVGAIGWYLLGSAAESDRAAAAIDVQPLPAGALATLAGAF